MSSKKSRLTRQKIAAVALAIADREGFEAVSMRRVAQELKVGTMSLYYYVKTKDDLVHDGRCPKVLAGGAYSTGRLGSKL